MNCLPEVDDVDLWGDKKSWATASYRDPGSYVTGSDNKNPGVTKVGQPVLLSDVNCIRPC